MSQSEQIKLFESKQGFEPVTNCNQLKLTAEDGKKRLTDVATTEELFRIYPPRTEARKIVTPALRKGHAVWRVPFYWYSMSQDTLVNQTVSFLYKNARNRKIIVKKFA